MKASLVILLFASSLIASAPAVAQLAPGCGPNNVQFDVKTQGGSHAAPGPDPGKALIIFMQDDARFESRPRPTTRFGIDGAWVGGTHANSFFSVSIEPGEHHLCASWQGSAMLDTSSRSMAAAHLTAEAGKTYYFRARDFAARDSSVSVPEVKFEPVADSDEAQVLMNFFSLSTSHPKK